jgi:L-fucose isomerase-like protein
VDYTCISARDIIDEMDNLPDNSPEESQELTDKLIKNAEKVHMSREDVLQSVKFYTAVKNVMNKHESNGFAIPCFEICAKRIMEERKVIFCLTHTLLKDEGFPSACEGDISALMAMVLLMQLSVGLHGQLMRRGKRDELAHCES